MGDETQKATECDAIHEALNSRQEMVAGEKWFVISSRW